MAHPVYEDVLRIGRQDSEAIYLDLGCFCMQSGATVLEKVVDVKISWDGSTKDRVRRMESEESHCE